MTIRNNDGNGGETLAIWRETTRLNASQMGWEGRGGGFRDGFIAKEQSEAGESFFSNSDLYQEREARLIHSGHLFAPAQEYFHKWESRRPYM